MIIDANTWNKRISQIENADIKEFKANLIQNPFRPIVFNGDYDAFQLTMAHAEKRFSKLGNFGETCIKIIEREKLFYDAAKIRARSNFIRQLMCMNSIDFDEICEQTKLFIQPKLQLRKGIMVIRKNDNSLIVQYPNLSELHAKNGFINLGAKKAREPIDTIIVGYLNALKLMMIHPFSDGNGRTCRLIASAALVEALNLNHIPFIEPFIRARILHISDTIAHYMQTGEVNPFLFAFSGGVRDGLEQGDD